MEVWVDMLSKALRETIIVAQFVIIVGLWRRGEARGDSHTETLIALLKESSEDKVQSSAAIHTMRSALDVTNETLRRVESSLQRRHD